MEAGELAALRAILMAMYRHPELLDGHYIEIFQVCCTLSDEEKYKNATKSIIQDFIITNGTKSSPELTMLLVTYSLLIIGSESMRAAIRCNKDAFTPTILRHWKSLFITMTVICEENMRNPQGI